MQRSGALYMDCHESWASTPPRFLFLFFHNNTSGDNHGHDCWLNSSLNITNPFAYSFSTTPAKRVYFMGTSESKEFNSWIPQGTMIYSKTGGADTEGCGLSALSTPCSSLEYSLSRLQELRTGLVNMLQAKFQPEVLNIGEMTVTMKGDGKDATVISTSQVPQSASSVIVLSSGSLCLTNVSVEIEPPSSSLTVFYSLAALAHPQGRIQLENILISGSEANNNVVHSVSLLNVQNGYLGLSSCTISEIAVDTLPLIAFQAPEQLGMKNVLMESISRKSGNGGIMEMDVEEQEIFRFDNVTFRNCICQQGNGGAMFVALKTNSMFTVGQDVAVNFNECCVPTDDQSKGKGGALYIKVCSDEPLFILNALSFERCNAWKGKNVFVEAVNLGTCVNENTIKFGRDGMLDDDLMGFENNDTSHLIPLRLFLSGAFVPPVHVGGPNNRDFSGCGYASYPCSTLKHAVSLRFSAADRLLSLHSQFVWNEEMTLDGFAWNICCEQENTSISFKPVAPVEGDGFIACASSSLFQNICFTLCDQPEFSFRSLLVCLGPSLSIADCSLKMENDDSVLTNSFAEIRKGTFSISNFHIQQLTADLSSPALSELICVSEDEASIDANGLICKQLIMRNKGDFLRLSSGKSSEIKNSVFEDGRYADGCCVQWTNGQSLKVRNTSFASEIRTSGNGSCINVKGASENFKSMMITNCSFDSCSVQEDESCGGAICGAEDAKCGLTISDCIFHSCTAPEGLLGKGYGGGICLYCSSESDDLFSIASPVSSLEYPNSAAIGKDLFIQSPNLTNTLTNKTLPFAVGSADLTDDSMRGYDGADKVHAIPLVYFYRVITNEVCASETGQDVAPCGFDTYPCRSVSFSFKRQNGSKSNVVLSPLFTLAESVVADGEKTYTIGGVAERSIVIVQGAKSPEAGLFCSSISLGFSVIINSIAFKLPTTIQTHSSLMHHKGSGNMRVENCEFEPQEAVESHSFSLIAAESGDITISDCSFKNIAFVAAWIVSCSGSSQTLIDKATITNATTLTGSSLITATTSTAELTVRDSSFTSVAKSNCVAIQTAFIQALTLNNTNIENIERSSNNGGAVECTVGNGGSVVIEGGSMKKCVCEGWNGGGLHISVEAGGNVQVGNTSSAETAIEECSSKENGGKGGYGGGIMLLLNEGAQNVIIKNVLFTLCSAPKGGSNIFMEAPVLENVAKATVLAHSFNTSVEDMPVLEELGGFDGSNKRDVIPLVLFFRRLSSTAHVSGTGIDYYKCGYADFPCLTIPFSESLMKESSGVILVESSFNINDKIELKTKNMSIKAKESRSEIRVGAGGGGASGGMIETSKDVNIEQISFVHPSSLGEAISFLFMCLNERLCISDCQVEMEAASGLTCSFSLIGVLGGELKCEHFSVLNSRYGSVEIIVLDGSGTNNAVKCNMNDVNFTDITSRSEKGMMSVKSVQEFGMENSKVQNTNQMNCPFFSFEGTANITMKNSTFSEISRQNGFGGLMNGRVNEKEKIEITNCTMDICNSTSEDMCGGCVHVDVGDYGTFLFDGNTATRCKVFGDRGFGGGLYIILNTLKSKYSLKMIEFSENEANRGKNIYIVCPTPREAIKPTLFDKSADENMEEEELWVYDTSGSMPDGESLRRYLFASDAEIVFLDTTNGTDSPECGTDLYPCQTMDTGFTKMTDNQSTLHIQGSTELNRDVNRAGKSLTVRGKAGHSTLNIETNGHFGLSEGSETPSLIFNNIRFALLAQSGRSELINAQTGTLFLKDCIFDESERSDAKIEFWLLECRRAEASFTTVIINTLSFTESVGIARVTEGIIEMEDVNISDISSKGNGLVQGCEGSDLLLRNIKAESCVVENGQVVSVSGKASLSITKNSEFGTCENLNGNGGAVSVKGCANEEFIFANISLQSCTADEMEMKGGGFFFEFTEQYSRTFSVMDCSFGSNKAKFGKDAFISCFDLNNSVTLDQFARLSGDGENGTVEMMGTDNVNFKNENVNLTLFLVQGKFEVAEVSPTGLDVLGCGSSENPCQSLWRGFQNLVPETRERQIRINVSAMVNDSYDLHSFLTISSSTDKTAELLINPKIERGEETSVFSSTMSLTLHSISLLMPQAFENGQTIVFESNSPSGMLDFQSSSFNVEREGEIAYQLVHMASGSLLLFNCSVSIFRFFQTPFVACGSVQLSNCNISKVCTSGSVEGGALRVCLTNSNNAAINETTACKCTCEAKEGMGGFMFLNSTDSLEEKPLSIISSVFEANEAALGKNIFVQASDLNTTVTEDVFAFDYEQLKDNPDLFVGSDRYQNNVDLFVFLIRFKSDTVFVSSSGFDVKRCGSEFIACRSFWKGFGQIDQAKQEKIMLIDQAAAVTDQYDVSNFTIKSIVKMELEEASSLLFETANESNEICFFSNSYKLSVVDLALKMRKVEEGAKVCMIKNIQGTLSLEDCSFETSADNAGASFRADVLFVMMNSGEFFVKKLKVKASVRKDLFCINSGCLCNFDGMDVKELSSDRGCVVNVEQQERNANAEQAHISLNGSLFSSVVRSDDGSCVVKSSSNVPLSLDINGSTFEFCRSPESEKGGAIFVNLASDGLDDGYVIAVSSQFHQQNSIATEFRKHLSIFLGSLSAITGKSDYSGIIYVEGSSHQIEINSLSVENMSSKANIGSHASFSHCSDISMESCLFNGDKSLRNSNAPMNEKTNICKWNGSLVDLSDCTAKIKDSSIANSSEGGLSVSGGETVIDAGLFVNNNPLIGKYPSARRNILCSDSAQLNIMSLKGGDGVFPNSSMWILNEGCSLKGIVEERASPLFIPTLRWVGTEEKEGVLDVVFRGTLLLPCNLSFRVVSSVGDVEQMETHEISESGFVSEEEVHGTTGLEMVRGAEARAEVRVCILFGDGHSPSATESFILKNRSETDPKGDERIVEGGKEGKSSWALIVVIFSVLFLIVLIVSIIMTIRWRKARNEAEDLREIVNENIRKDPKAFEMVTMEMSPEEQWRRAEREAEKKNDERIKKRVYEKSLGHSESSEHLLSESGSTEYILGRDSDKIPQWILEKVEEEGEIQKRSPSPSISSTSTTDTSDTDTTFVRGEDLCPTTSSMSNLVDAMACSSPHEKLIVDLRDSLFMLLHGRNKTKEMAIGTLQEREQTAAQILFWVANGALHSFDEMENGLSSLANLSPHIVLFSEHMVICIVMHSDLLSDDDSDSSSISSSTVVTSASDDDDDDSLPSSAFEEEDDFKKECLRWMAPELLINKKMGATKESVAFSIGMMLWECLTLQIPFGDYEAEVAGQKIVNGERPVLGSAGQSSFCSVVENCLNSLSQKRPSLATLKRELFLHFPPGAMVLTASDAIDRTMHSQQSGRGASSELACSESEILGNRY
ncbi:uncharacterized protein MONOS_2285 [Monocercomonoides exilis]|uniref:uncharacterized protein n=1 Tax=Monocercomonoides exilis TaxID=2049356 RepID=UPI0035594338|nr:hypothetical protein MONOS_2285 [Monocercomonoides exilis]|eukprot:MONOS_2285.1-p1 / transcript=MONOS_2285.1 / gene=MONOS_2285 / organism=Monocercomonoides_exilis_PA203 / gene_product=unspecified product / transcript_product=unspecified product / location=Mono_scaffold00046:82756-94073(+) / protein_length=3359 / sequence_SO=supercontig / SO=protein_coding / is_pseudo=false